MNYMNLNQLNNGVARSNVPDIVLFIHGQLDVDVGCEGLVRVDALHSHKT